VVGEGNDYSPIQQSYEIRKLRAENQRLKERLQAARLAHTDDDDDDDGESPDRKGAKAASRAATSRQRRFKTGDRVDNLYFGTPGLANIVSDVSSIVPPGSRVPPADPSHSSQTSTSGVTPSRTPSREAETSTSTKASRRRTRSPSSGRAGEPRARWLATSCPRRMKSTPI
jgi:hypothetical protein